MQRFEQFRNLMVMAAADQKFTDEEVALLSLRANRWGITNDEFEAALRYASGPNATLAIPAKREDRVKFLGRLLEMMAADGELAPVERRIFSEAAARLEISATELNQLIDDLL